MGDFNCKVGNEVIKGNDNRISMGGRMLRNLVKSKKLSILNSHKKNAPEDHGHDNNSKYVIDYMIIKRE